MPATSPAQSLGLILHGPTETPNPDIVLLDYRDPATFSALWLEGLESGGLSIAGQEIDLTDSTRQFLVIGNEPPDEIFKTDLPGLTDINFRSHFTATSWLAAWKVKWEGKFTAEAEKAQRSREAGNTAEEEKRQRVEERKLPRIAVIDPGPAGSAQGAARALQTILSARDANGQPLVPGTTVLNAPSLETICQWLNPDPTDTRTLAKNTPHLRELLKSTIWNELTSNREQHHALSNVLGPIILSGKKIDESCFKPVESDGENKNQEQAAASDRVSLLLRRLLSTCGLVSWEDKKSGEEPSSPSETGQDLQILLLDDQAKQGWEEWVKGCLPEAAGTMNVAVDPTALVEAISDALDPIKGSNEVITGYRNKDARFRLELPGFAAATHPVLLLDLRLFSGKEEAEREFLKTKLLPLVNHFTDKPDLAWPGFSTHAHLFQRAKDAVENGKLKPDTDEHHEVLTWLPRVVALADMSLPIILFSSTGRRDLVEPFKPYGNIVTTFEKPRLNDLRASGDSGNNARSVCVASLRDATGRARRWLKGRQAIKRIQNTTLDPLNEARTAFNGKTHFEIYHDETGQAEMMHFRVTSLLAGFDTESDATGYSTSLPIKFCGAGAADKEVLKDGRKPTPDEYPAAAATRWNDNFWPKIKNDFPPCLAAVAVRSTDTERNGQPDSIFDPEGLDTINWDLLSLLWESLLVDVLPALFKNRPKELNQISIRLFGATRFRPVMLAANNAEAAIKEANRFLMGLQDQWGIDLLQIFKDCSVKDGDAFVSEFDQYHNRLVKGSRYTGAGTQFKLLWRSLKEDSFWKLVSELLFGRRESPYYRHISSALRGTLGITLMYGSDKHLDDRGRHFHYFADVMGGLVVTDLAQNEVSFTVEPFKEVESRASVSYRDQILRILNANRMLDLRDCDAEALVCFDGLNHDHPKDLAYLALAERLFERLPMLSGESLRHLVALLQSPPSWLSQNRLSTPQRINKQGIAPLRPAVRGDTGRAQTSPETREWQNRNRRAHPTRSGVKWMLRQFKNGTEYEDHRGNWHDREAEGYYVRKSTNPYNRKITVYADADKIKEEPAEFKPAKVEQLNDKGGPKGVRWSPKDLLKSRHPRQTYRVSSGVSEQPSVHHNSQVSKAWIGPVPKGVKSDSLNSHIKESLPGWTPESMWAGGNVQGWWLPISREVGVEVHPLPQEVIFGAHRMMVNITNPVG